MTVEIIPVVLTRYYKGEITAHHLGYDNITTTYDYLKSALDNHVFAVESLLKENKLNYEILNAQHHLNNGLTFFIKEI